MVKGSRNEFFLSQTSPPSAALSCLTYRLITCAFGTKAFCVFEAGPGTFFFSRRFFLHYKKWVDAQWDFVVD